jgi:glycosyltransferase involved in cell wall biosynthesis
MTPKLSILIPTLPIREKLSSVLFLRIQEQKKAFPDQIEVLTNDNHTISIGAKRQLMLQAARGEYICFIDDDDRIADSYIELVMAGIATNPDCCSLNGIITTDGKDPKPFKHSIEYDSMYERDGVYYRPPNHLNTVRASIAKQMVFPDWQRSEDSNYCFQLQASGLLKVEYKIEPVLYYYDYVSDKRY